jgi:hypothetical protein
MTEKQESRWLYAKALELAILIKGPYRKDPEITERNASATIYQEYDPLAHAIARKIREGVQPETP